MSAHGPRVVPLAELAIPATSGWRRLPAIGATVGLLGIAVSLVIGGGSQQFYYSWLVSYVFFLSIAIGALFFVLVHHATKAGWGIVVRRLAENLMGTIPVMILLFIPILLGLNELYHWSHADAVAHDPLLAAKEPFLNPVFFAIRALIYLGCWSLLSFFFGGLSRRQDRSGDQALSARMVFWSGPSLYAFALTVSFAAFDWLMSLDPHWYSTIFGVYFFAGSVVSLFATLSILLITLGRSGLMSKAVTGEHFHDLGKLLFAFTVFWSYIAFSQFFLIWYANIPEETGWYLARLEGSWRPVTLALALGHFAIPFLYLLPRTIKRTKPLLLIGALWMLAAHYLDIYWLAMPTLHPTGPHLSWLDVTTFIGIGGVFLAVVSWFMCRDPLVPVQDPRLVESLAFENIV